MDQTYVHETIDPKAKEVDKRPTQEMLGVQALEVSMVLAN